MGCGNSKLNPEGELIPPRIRPLLARTKFLELRKRKNIGTNLRDGGAMSKKVLLKDPELEDENSMLVDNRKNMLCSSSQEKIELDDSASPIPSSNNPNTIHLEKETDDSPVLELKQDQHKSIQQEDENKKEGDDQERLDNEDNRGILCPGSPSFRVYFVEETQDDKQNVEMKDAAAMDDVSHKKSSSHDSVDSNTSAKSGEENTVLKKGKKGTTFNRVISKKRPVGVGMKNLLNVKSCYHLSCSGSDRANLLARKAEA